MLTRISGRNSMWFGLAAGVVITAAAGTMVGLVQDQPRRGGEQRSQIQQVQPDRSTDRRPDRQPEGGPEMRRLSGGQYHLSQSPDGRQVFVWSIDRRTGQATFVSTATAKGEATRGGRGEGRDDDRDRRTDRDRRPDRDDDRDDDSKGRRKGGRP